MDYRIRHWSASQDDQFAKCPELWYRVRILGQRIPPGIALVVGSGFHNACEVNFKPKIASGEDQPLDVLTDAAAEGFDKKIDDEGLLILREDRSKQKAIINEGRNQAVDLTKVMHSEFAPKIQPLLVEQKITMPDSELGIDWVGYLDLLTVDLRLSDTKSAKKAWSQADADSATQFTVYRPMVIHALGKEPTEMFADVFTKTKTPKYKPMKIERDDSDMEALRHRAGTRIATANAGCFPPAVRMASAWWCAPRFCGMWWTCRYIPNRLRRLPNV